MRVRNTTTCAFGLAAALTFAASSLAAQDTTRLRTTSQTRINVSKGEVQLRVDTVYTTRYDTVRVENTIVRVDTVTVAAPVPIMPPLSEWYWGLFAGPTSPEGTFDRLYTNGFHVGAALGWDPRDSWWGFRMQGYVNQIGREQRGFTVLNDDAGFFTPGLLLGSGTPLIWNGEIAGKVKAPLGGWAPYLLGGLGFSSFKRIATVASRDRDGNFFVDDLTDEDFDDLILLDNDDIIVCGESVVSDGRCFRLANNDSWRTRFNWNFGLGTDFRIGSQEMYLEARWVGISTNDAYTWYLPISLGLKYF